MPAKAKTRRPVETRRKIKPPDGKKRGARRARPLKKKAKAPVKRKRAVRRRARERKIKPPD